MTHIDSKPSAPNPTRSSIRRPQARYTALVATFLLLCFVVANLVEWPGSAIMRLAGSYTGSALLKGASPADAITAVLCLVAATLALFLPARQIVTRWLFLLCAASLVLILGVQALLGDPEVANAWNSRGEEIARTVTILLMYFAFFQLTSSAIGVSRRVSSWSFWSIYACGAICFVFCALQSRGILNNLYFQWFVNAHLPRPAGGFSHPHYYAASCVIAAAAVMMMARRRYISTTHAFVYAALMMVGTALSTSRVGLISAILSLLLYMAFVARRNPGRLVIIGASSLVGVILLVLGIGVLATVSDDVAKMFRGVTHAYEVFTSVFGGDGGDILRGRGDHWAHEIEIITDDPAKLMFGVGYQPYVSHNLFLRQLQVSGIFGTLAYAGILIALVMQSRNQARPADRDLVWVAWLPILISLNTLPILTSVTLNAALVLLGSLAAQPAQQESRSGRAQRPARFGANANTRAVPSNQEA